MPLDYIESKLPNLYVSIIPSLIKGVTLPSSNITGSQMCLREKKKERKT